MVGDSQIVGRSQTLEVRYCIRATVTPRPIAKLLSDRNPIACDGRLDDMLHVLLEKVALRHELQRRRAHFGTVVGLVPVALGNRSARVASRYACCLVRR